MDKEERMTHNDLVIRATKWLVNSYGCGFALPELVACTDTGEIADSIGFKWGSSVLVECKTSKEDFKRDFTKKFRKEPSLGMGDYRYYMTLPGVISKEELPDKWGLLYVSGKRVNIIKKAEYIGANLKCERVLFASIIRRVHLQNQLNRYLRMSGMYHSDNIEELNEEIG